MIESVFFYTESVNFQLYIQCITLYVFCSILCKISTPYFKLHNYTITEPQIIKYVRESQNVKHNGDQHSKQPEPNLDERYERYLNSSDALLRIGLPIFPHFLSNFPARKAVQLLAVKIEIPRSLCFSFKQSTKHRTRLRNAFLLRGTFPRANSNRPKERDGSSPFPSPGRPA